MSVTMNHARRLRSLRLRMGQEGLDALLITHLPDVRYLCGFTGSNAVLCVTARGARMFTDGRYTAQAAEETRAARVVIARTSAQKEACRWLVLRGLGSTGAKICGFDPAHTAVSELKFFEEAVRSAGRRGRGFFKPIPVSFVAELRLIKDAAELKLIEQAANLGVRIFRDLLPRIRPGTRETEVAGHLELSARLHGAEGMSFETIVASGMRSSLPHGRATDQRLPRRGFLTLDFGVILKGYCSDMTRTVFLGKATSRERFTYDAVREAQRAAVAAVKPGVSSGEVDEAARSVLRKAGLAQYFTHSTGHGVGLEIHEPPRIAAAQPQTLLPGMVITVEPGAYLPGRFGVRIEDMVAVTEDGSRVLTSAPTAWKQI